MANRLKSKKGQGPGSGKLKPDKETRVTARQIAKDERTHKITGAIFLLLAIFLFLAFTSYLYTWQEDQSMVFKGGWHVLMPSYGARASNLLGNLGALVSHLFFYKGFGLASYLFCSFFFTVGVNLLFKRKVFSISRNVRYVVSGLLYLSVLLAFVTRGSGFPWGGAAGNMIDDWLTQFLGWVGTAAVLFVAGLAYFIWWFNPVFKVPKLPVREKGGVPEPVEAGKAEKDKEGAGGKEGAKLFVDKAFMQDKPNILKEEGGVVAIAPIGEVPEIEFTITEREPVAAEEPVGEVEPEGEVGQDGFGKMTEPVVEEVGEVDDWEAEPVLEIKAPPPVNAGPAESLLPENLPDYEPTLDLRDYKYPTLDLLETHGSDKIVQDASELEANKNQIINTLKNYDIAISKISATVGPTVTLYEIVPAPGVRISRIKNLEDDIALSLAALGIRIIAPIPGKGTIGIEVPNVKKTIVSMRTLLASEKFQYSNFNLPIAIGKKIDNENFIVDLSSMPHLLMAGATGQGKSVGVNAILVSLLYKKHPSQLKLVLVDPKKVELSLYRMIEKHFLAKLPGEEEEPIITDTKKVVHTLNALCIEMDRRYDLLKEANARNLKEYNEKFVKRRLNPQKGHEYLPFIVLVIDEFADLIMTAGKEIEMPIARLAQLARAVGIHLIIATQRPSVNIITGTIKANFPARVAFKVSSKIDSRTILDAGGADQLIGKGDMLISYNGEITRLQCAFVDTPEVERVTEFIGQQRGYPEAYKLPEYVDEKELEGKEFDLADRDPLFEEAARLIVVNQLGSTSLIQRKMKLGYNRAGRLMDQLEAAGVVGPGAGSKPRDVLIKSEIELNQYLNL
ncbi:MAG TPA: DNA translocase FtsK 4TM domain-containing protein [Puia sp.]|nr:DNA translocase FtsK 4TM domain-containing protein [Puia sp.]